MNIEGLDRNHHIMSSFEEQGSGGNTQHPEITGTAEEQDQNQNQAQNQAQNQKPARYRDQASGLSHGGPPPFKRRTL